MTGLGYVGIVGAPNPCGFPLLAAPTVTAFKDSMYGVNYDRGTPGTLTPYVADTGTMLVTLGTPVSGDLSSGTQCVIDDSTIVFTDDSGGSTSLRVLSRSGLSISVSGMQETRTGSNRGLARIDSSHFIRCYETTTMVGPVAIIEVLSVGGGSVSVGSTTPMTDSGLIVLHTDGSGSLIASTSSGAVLYALPFTLSGVTQPAFIYETAYPFSGSFGFDDAVDGSTECAFTAGANGWIGFYWDGSAGHWGTVSPQKQFDSSIGLTGGVVGGGGSGNDANPYLALNAALVPPDTILSPALVSQSGADLDVTHIAPTYKCPLGGNYQDGSRGGGNVAGSTRHAGNSAVITEEVLIGTGPTLLGYDLKVITW